MAKAATATGVAKTTEASDMANVANVVNGGDAAYDAASGDAGSEAGAGIAPTCLNVSDESTCANANSASTSVNANAPASASVSVHAESIARAHEVLDGFWREQDELYRDLAASFGISESALDILYAIYLAGEGGVSQRDICVQMCIGKQTVNSSIHKLEREGVVELKSGPGRRGLLANLTPVGLEFAERTVAPMVEAELAALREFDDRELELSLLLGRRYTDALRSHFADIPGVRLTSQNNKVALQDGEAAPRGVKAAAQDATPALRNDGAAERAGKGEAAPSGESPSFPNEEAR